MCKQNNVGYAVKTSYRLNSKGNTGKVTSDVVNRKWHSKDETANDKITRDV